MAVAYTTQNRALTVSLSGELDPPSGEGGHSGAGGGDRPPAAPAACGGLRGVTFMDSAGIAILLRLWQRMEELGGSIHIRDLPEQPGRVFRAAGLAPAHPHRTHPGKE